MNLNLQDPLLWLALTVLLFSLATMVWLLGKLRNPKIQDDSSDAFKMPPIEVEDLPPTPSPVIAPLPTVPIAKEPTFEQLKAQAQKPFATITPANNKIEFVSPAQPNVSPISTPSAQVPTSLPVSKEVVDRLDGMSQRLADMQMVLLRQVNKPQSSGPAGSSPFPPEVVDKLLKIIANVTQQIEVMQKSFGMTPPPFPTSQEGSGIPLTVNDIDKPFVPPTPMPAAAPKPMTTKVATPPPTGTMPKPTVPPGPGVPPPGMTPKKPA